MERPAQASGTRRPPQRRRRRPRELARAPRRRDPRPCYVGGAASRAKQGAECNEMGVHNVFHGAAPSDTGVERRGVEDKLEGEGKGREEK